MKLPEDLKHYRAPDAFDLVPPEVAAGAVILLLIIVSVLWR